MKKQGTQAIEKVLFWAPSPADVWVVGELVKVDEKTSKYNLNLNWQDSNDKSNIIEVKREACIATTVNEVSESVNDLISLSSVHDATILNSTKLRFQQKIIYTSIGAVLMALNPFQTIEGLYGTEKIQEYSNVDVAESHIYQIPSRAYNALVTFGQNQSLLISGESGAGKVTMAT